MKSFILSLLLILNVLSASAGQPGPVMQNLLAGQSKALTFTENRGQLADENGKLLTDVKYYGSQSGVSLYCRADKLSFVFTKITEGKPETAQIPDDQFLPEKSRMPAKTTIETSRMDMIFLGANANLEIISEGQTESYTNYYLGHTPEAGITNVHNYKKLTYRNIYPRIDLVLLSKEKGVEYEFIVHPGGKPSDIKIHWEGTDKIHTQPGGGIIYTNKLGEMTESKAICINNGKLVESKSAIESNNVCFKLGNYDKTQDLIIDPALIWGTYYGGGSKEIPYGLVLDDSGSILMTGYTLSATGIASTGAYQDTFAGGYDAFLTKFNDSGKLIWATYFGGSGFEFSYSIALDKSNRILITGTTGSSTGMATSGSYQTSVKDNDAFIAQFDSSGFRLWCTYYGGPGNDEGSNIMTDKNNDIIFVGYTSNVGLATSGAFQTSIAGGTDIVLAKFESSGKRIWCTYFGGNNYEAYPAITIDTTGSIYIVGNTSSTKGIATTGAYQTLIASMGDCFLAKFSSLGTRIWSTYYGGTSQEGAESITFDKKNKEIYISGTTASINGIATSCALQTSYQGGFDVFFAKFNMSGLLLWGTYYGGVGIETSGFVSADSNGNIYACVSSSSLGMATKGAFQTSNGGGITDMIILNLNPYGNLNWASYYGGKDSESGFGVMCDNNGFVYFYGITKSNNNISTSGAYQTFNAGGTDVFLGKCRTNKPCKFQSIIYGDTNVCVNTTKLYYRMLNKGFTCHWNILGDCTFRGSDSDSIYVNCNEEGGKTIQLNETDGNCMNFEVLNIKIKPRPFTKIWKFNTTPHDYVFLTKDTNYTLNHWYFGDGTDTIATYHIAHTYARDSTYKVSLYAIDSNGCDATSDTTLRVYTYIESLAKAAPILATVQPNPFNEQTEIKYILPKNTHLRIFLCDITGKEISQLCNEMQAEGKHTQYINTGKLNLSPGLYFLKIQADETIQILKLSKID